MVWAMVRVNNNQTIDAATNPSSNAGFLLALMSHHGTCDLTTVNFPIGDADYFNPVSNQTHLTPNPHPSTTPPTRNTNLILSSAIVSSGLDGAAELRLRGLRARPVRGRPEQGHPASGGGAAGRGGQALLLPRGPQAVPLQPLPAQRHLQGGLEPLRLRLLRDGVPGPVL